MKNRNKKFIAAGVIAAVLVIIFVFLHFNPFGTKTLKDLGASIPLPLFTFIIALIDGFNPCNLFILTMLVSLLLAESHSRKRIFAVGFSFVLVVYIFYFLFMTAWLNIFKYIGFIDPLRYLIAGIAIIAGGINVKELFFYRKWVTLMVQPKYISPLKKKVKKVSGKIKKAALPTLVGSSIALAFFASLVELPCTAGFPLIYTGVLTGMYLKNSLMYYVYLLFYNLVYVLPLTVIILLFGYTFKGKKISKRTMAWIKFFGGAIMLLLGLLLIFAPGIIGL